MREQLAGKVAFITGPARGIGAEVARMLAARGMRLALAGLEPERLAALAQELGGQHVWFPCDVTDQAALDRAVAGTVQALGGIDVVVANAGIASNGTVAVTPVEALVRVIEVNLIGVVRTVSATLPHVVARKGHYLLVSSIAAIAAAPALAAYAGSKSGVEQFGNGLRLEVRAKGVTVGIAHPGWVDTDLVRDTRRDLRSFDALLRRLPGPFGVVTPVRDCAAAIVAGIERRKRKVFVPRSLAPLAMLRQFFMSPLSDFSLRGARGFVDELEREAAALGRSFGENSVESRPPTPDTRHR